MALTALRARQPGAAAIATIVALTDMAGYVRGEPKVLRVAVWQKAPYIVIIVGFVVANICAQTTEAVQFLSVFLRIRLAAIQMNVLLLFLLYVLLVVNIVSKCSRKKSEKTESRKKRKRHRDRDREEPKETPPKEQTAAAPQAPEAIATAIAPEPPMAIATAHEADETTPDELFKCRDYTPAIFHDLQNLFDLLKQS